MNIQEIIAQLNEVQRQMREHGEAALKNAFREFFESCPAVQEVAWTQYAPYFNDGDACEFSVGVPCFHAAIVDVDHEDYDHWTHFSEDGPCVYSALIDKTGARYDYKTRDYVGGSALGAEDQHALEACKALRNAFELEDLFEQIFGSHVSIRATCGGFEVEEYQHD